VDGLKVTIIREEDKAGWQEDKGEGVGIGEQRIMDGQECGQEGQEATQGTEEGTGRRKWAKEVKHREGQETGITGRDLKDMRGQHKQH